MTKYRIAQMKQYLELILGIQSIVSLAVLALQRFMMVTRDRQVAFLCRYIGCAEKHVQVVVVTKGLVCACVFKHKPCQHHGFAVPSFNRLFHPAHPCLHLDLQVGNSLVGKGPSPKSLGLAENFKYQHMLFCRDIKICRNLLVLVLAS